VDPVRQIADAVLYEGYILWPYRRSALKNQRRWGFGGIYPPGTADERSVMHVECLLEAPDATPVEVTVRFLQVVERAVERVTPAGREPVPELTVGRERHLAWDEAVERELVLPAFETGDGAAMSVPIAIPAGSSEELLGDEGAVVRRWERLAGRVECHSLCLEPGLHRVSVTVANSGDCDGCDRATLLARTFCSTHAVLRTRAGGFVSLADPPERLRDAAADCQNDGAWPVPVGAPGDRTTMLASPIILEDHPRIAPESPGDLFDGGEIDQMLVLNILSLTDEEKAEMRASDPRAREILERCSALSADELMQLHGAMRELR
jgi:hypothetical protein